MNVRERLWSLVRLFALFTVMVAVALVSAITTIRLTIHGHQATTPNLVGVPIETAQRITSGLGLELKVEDKLFNDQYPANQIISQVPQKGAAVKVGQHIHVLVSLGPPRVTVPQLVGDSLRTAQIKAVQRGLMVGDVAAVHWLGSDVDSIMAQDPPSATADVHSPAVNILVSLGEPPPAFICPSFVGRSLSDARRALENSGFKVGQVTPVASESVPADTILSQTPPPGSKIGPDTVFDFQAAGLPQPVLPPISPESVPATPPPTPQN
jgi:beta-lactam-binding protein with PASTA domain